MNDIFLIFYKSSSVRVMYKLIIQSTQQRVQVYSNLKKNRLYFLFLLKETISIVIIHSMSLFAHKSKQFIACS